MVSATLWIVLERRLHAGPSSCNSLEQPERARWFFTVCRSLRRRLEQTLDLHVEVVEADEFHEI
jgi:hypothetical protein